MARQRAILFPFFPTTLSTCSCAYHGVTSCQRLFCGGFGWGHLTCIVEHCLVTLARNLSNERYALANGASPSRLTK
jgi:hypothetical protein